MVNWKILSISTPFPHLSQLFSNLFLPSSYSSSFYFIFSQLCIILEVIASYGLWNFFPRAVNSNNDIKVPNLSFVFRDIVNGISPSIEFKPTTYYTICMGYYPIEMYPKRPSHIWVMTMMNIQAVLQQHNRFLKVCPNRFVNMFNTVLIYDPTLHTQLKMTQYFIILNIPVFHHYFPLVFIICWSRIICWTIVCVCGWGGVGDACVRVYKV